jgi:hypothetical protein
MNAATVAAFDAVSLLESLRGRGATVSIKGTDAGAWLHVAPRGVLSDGERADFRRHKRELLAALNTPDDVAPAHRWRDDPTGDDAATGDAAPDVAASATTGSAAAAPAIPDDLPGELTATEAAAAILDNAYFNLARGGVWCIGWQQPSRSAWRYACLATGGQLMGTNRVPDMSPDAAIDWAKAQQEITT